MDRDTQIIKCPECHATYRVPAGKLVPGKSRIRCLKCQQAFVFVEEEAPTIPSAVSPEADRNEGPFAGELKAQIQQQPAGEHAFGETRKCPFCAEEINAAALKCKHCGSMLGSPDRGQKPESSVFQTPGAYVEKGKVRGPWKVLGLALITFGVYYFYWLYVNVKEIRRAFLADEEGSVADSAMSFFYALITASIITFVVTIVVFALNRSAISHHPPLIIFVSLVCEGLSCVFFYYFTKTIVEGQKRANLTPLHFQAMFGLILVAMVLSFLSNFISVMSFIGAVVSMVYIYMIQKEINRIWS